VADLVEKISKNRIELAAAQTVAGSIAGREAKRRRENQSYRKSLNTAEKQLEELQSDWRAIEKVLQSARSGLREIEMSIEQIEANRRRLIDENRSARSRWLELKKSRMGKEESRIQTSLELIRLKEELSCWEELQNTVTRSRHRFERELEEINDRLRNAETKVARTEGELKKIDNELENKKARGREQRQLLVEELEVEPDPEALEALETGEYEKYSSSDLNKEIRKSKNRLRSLQPVNMLAGKEAEKLETEVSDIAGQKDDLEDSCRKLGDMIRRLNARARQQFREAFSEIQDYFQDFVSELFKGGTGRLALTEGPVLEAGVNVEIEPPGEKLKTMSSLSGGEKTLAAIAFLFALFERKASPFCFLDEVDAPFDDENVAQLIGLLNRYSSDTQFVIITHNKSTMQAAEQLYGVTMEESGVTSIVRIDLSSADSFREKQEVG
jgi:chromosome segregation protein